MKNHANYLSLSIAALVVATFFSHCAQPVKVKYGIDDRDVEAVMGDNLKLRNPYNYENQAVPQHIRQSIFREPVTNQVAALGRALFYDKKLSENTKVSCGSCHQQQFAFGANTKGADGAFGEAVKQPMRLVNLKFSSTSNLFWDSREEEILNAVKAPILDHTEMGFSGKNGQKNMRDLIDRLQNTQYYNQLFLHAFGSTTVTEEGLEKSLAQFILSIQSYDSKFDKAMAGLNTNDKSIYLKSFPSFNQEENFGKNLFFGEPILSGNMRLAGGFGCARCHFDGEAGFVQAATQTKYGPQQNNTRTIVGESNGITKNVNGTRSHKLTSRAPSMRDLVNNAGMPNTHFFSDASAKDLDEVLEHYNTIFKLNERLDERLRQGTSIINYDMSVQNKKDLVAFLKTMSGKDVYTNPKWSNPFL